MDGEINLPLPPSGPIPPSGVGGEEETGGTTGTTPTGGYNAGASTLSESEQEELYLQYVFYPQLPFPNVTILNYNDLHDLSVNGGVNFTTFLIVSNNGQEQDDVKKMLDAWLENIKEIDRQKIQDEERRHIEGTDPITRARVESGDPTGVQFVASNSLVNFNASNGLVNFNTNLQGITPEDRITQVTHYIIDIGDTYHNVTRDQNLPVTPFLAIGIVIGTSGVFESAMVDPGIAGVNPIQDVWSALPQQFIPPDLRAELGYLGALMLTGVIYEGSRVAITEGIVKGSKPNEKELAKSYAEAVVTAIGSPDFNALVMAIVTKSIDPNSPLADQSSRFVKLILLASALAVLYKAETGKLTAEEFAAMIKGEMTFEAGDPRIKIIAMMRQELQGSVELGIPPLPVEQQEAIIAGLLAYIDTDPPIEQLTEPGSVFNGVMESGEFGKPIEEQQM